jgi:K+-sensing histidine kinase KdpD
MKEVELFPSAAALVESMRDFGYSLETALADVIDNSITANATNIWLCTTSKVEGLKIAIIDDGDGMTYDQLMSALPPGSRNPRDSRDKTDLGRFGLGLKTASRQQLSQSIKRKFLQPAGIWISLVKKISGSFKFQMIQVV